MRVKPQIHEYFFKPVFTEFSFKTIYLQNKGLVISNMWLNEFYARGAQTWPYIVKLNTSWTLSFVSDFQGKEWDWLCLKQLSIYLHPPSPVSCQPWWWQGYLIQTWQPRLTLSPRAVAGALSNKVKSKLAI